MVETARGGPGRPPHVVGLELKRSERWDRTWERPLRSLASTTGAVVDRMIGVYTGPRTYCYDGLDVLPVAHFLDQLHQGKVF